MMLGYLSVMVIQIPRYYNPIRMAVSFMFLPPLVLPVIMLAYIFI